MFVLAITQKTKLCAVSYCAYNKHNASEFRIVSVLLWSWFRYDVLDHFEGLYGFKIRYHLLTFKCFCSFKLLPFSSLHNCKELKMLLGRGSCPETQRGAVS